MNEPQSYRARYPQRGLYATKHKDLRHEQNGKQRKSIPHPSTKSLLSRMQTATRKVSCKAAQSRSSQTNSACKPIKHDVAASNPAKHPDRRSCMARPATAQSQTSAVSRSRSRPARAGPCMFPPPPPFLHARARKKEDHFVLEAVVFDAARLPPRRLRLRLPHPHILAYSAPFLHRFQSY